MEKVVLAFSGGLDTTVCVKLLEEKYNYEVVTACVDVGQGEEEMENQLSNYIEENITEVDYQEFFEGYYGYER